MTMSAPRGGILFYGILVWYQHTYIGAQGPLFMLKVYHLSIKHDMYLSFESAYSCAIWV